MFPRFPLPADHAFAATSHRRHHNGKEGLDCLTLASAQNRLRNTWGHRNLTATGYYDGITQNAVADVQQAYGLPGTGWLDAETWDALWCGPPVP